MDMCNRLVLVMTTKDSPPDRVTCIHPKGHSGLHIGNVIDGRRYEWHVPAGCIRGRFVPN